ncbi:MAG TPA: dienelactone hydrolase family protein [Casimicrobiaceae bacterium]|nr:dienelactone hydrolase family protein [Casimicrobiaceae bacterium]
MERKTAADFHPEVLRWFDRYAHGEVDRRGFLQGIARYAVGGVSATMLLESLTPRFAQAQQVAAGDSRISGKYVEFPSPEGSGTLRAYLVGPAGASGKLPGIVVVHENRGLNPHIEDIARRLALEKFLVLAPDALTPLGGYPGDEDKARELFAKLDPAKVRNDFVAAVHYLSGLPEVGKVGVVGFCFGGGVANALATRLPELAATVTYYGVAPSPTDAARIKAPLLLHYAENDERVNATRPAYEVALKQAGVSYQVYLYPGVQHAFSNDTTPRYDEAAAKLAWTRTLEFLNKNLRGQG